MRFLPGVGHFLRTAASDCQRPLQYILSAGCCRQASCTGESFNSRPIYMKANPNHSRSFGVMISKLKSHSRTFPTSADSVSIAYCHADISWQRAWFLSHQQGYSVAIPLCTHWSVVVVLVSVPCGCARLFDGTRSLMYHQCQLPPRNLSMLKRGGVVQACFSRCKSRAHLSGLITPLLGSPKDPGAACLGRSWQGPVVLGPELPGDM